MSFLLDLIGLRLYLCAIGLHRWERITHWWTFLDRHVHYWECPYCEERRMMG